jgi:hypothetical protein
LTHFSIAQGQVSDELDMILTKRERENGIRIKKENREEPKEISIFELKLSLGRLIRWGSDMSDLGQFQNRNLITFGSDRNF